MLSNLGSVAVSGIAVISCLIMFLAIGELAGGTQSVPCLRLAKFCLVVTIPLTMVFVVIVIGEALKAVGG
jgi:uncharacterized membrane protein YwzB